MPIPSVPGFTYDEAKKKYFKTQPNHIAAANSRYSEQSIKKEAERQAILKKQKLHHEREMQTRIARPRLRDPLLGGSAGLERELDHGCDGRRSAGIAAWAQGLESTTMLCTKELPTRFAFDDATGCTVVAFADVAGRAITLRYGTPTTVSNGRHWHRLMRDVDVAATSPISSLTISPSHMLLTTSLGGSEPPSAHITPLLPPQEIQSHADWDPSTSDITRPPPPPHSMDNPSTLMIRPYKSGNTWWTSSANPSQASFAIGTSTGTVLLFPNNGSWTMSRTMTFANNGVPKARSIRTDYRNEGTEEEILSLSWLTPNTLINGSRSGHVHLWDIRVALSLSSSENTTSTSNPITHPSSITHVVGQSSNKIIIAGIENQMCTYDLRFLSNSTTSSRSAQGYPTFHSSTIPLLTFPAYRNRDRNGLAVGFDLKGSFIATGTDDEKVQMFDAETGRELVIGPRGKLSKQNLAGTASCIKIRDSPNGKEGISVYIAAGTNIEKWVW